MNYEAISVVLQYIDERLEELEETWPREDFEKRSYSRWATFEIVEALMEHPVAWAWSVIDEFMLKMILFSYLAKEDNRKFLFAIEVAEDIQALLI